MIITNNASGNALLTVGAPAGTTTFAGGINGQHLRLTTTEPSRTTEMSGTNSRAPA